MSPARWIVLVVALILVVIGLGQVSTARGGLDIRTNAADGTPITTYRLRGNAPAPAVVIAHGFAGSKQLMQAYALTLAQAGYVVVSFDFLGHGRNAAPMTGNLDAIEGTTQLLMDQTARVIDHALSIDGVDGRVALLGHSMATDIIVRQAARDPRIDTVVAISMFSQAATDTVPGRLLTITGAWEGALRTEALRVLRLVDPAGVEGVTVTKDTIHRKAVVAPGVEHVGVLYSRTGLVEARSWLNEAFGRNGVGPVAAMGLGLVLSLAGLVALAWPLASLLPAGKAPRPLTPMEFWITLAIPSIATPLLLATFETRLLPVLVADYVALHMLVYGGLTLAILRGFGYRVGRLNGVAMALLVIYALAVFGGVLDRYVSSFMPAGPRPLIIMVLAIGTIPYMIGEARLLEAGHAGWRYAIAARTAFLASLGLAVALDFERLFFLLIILPVIVLFFVIFGLMSGWVGRRTGSSAAIGLAMGLILAWSLGVTFPLFVSS